MKKNTITLIFICFFLLLNACQQRFKLPIIAHSKDHTITLTQTQLSKWLEDYPQFKHESLKEQIEGYFIQQALFRQRHDLPSDTQEKTEFLQTLKIHQSARTDLKRQIFAATFAPEIDVQQAHQTLLAIEASKQPKTRLYQIYKRFVPEASQAEKDQTVKEVLSIKNQVDDLTSFKQLAIQHSDSQTRLQKGLIGNIKHDHFNSALDGIIGQLQAGQMSEVIRLKTGAVLFYCEKKIPVKHKTSEQLLKRARKYHTSKLSLHHWNNELAKINAQLSIVYDWSVINSNHHTLHSPAAQTSTQQISKQQLLWLLNDSGSSLDSSDFSVDHIKKITDEYFQNRLIFNQLPIQQQSKITERLSNDYIEAITSQVLLKQVKAQLTEPTEEQIKKHHQLNHNKYFMPKRYDLSIIVMPHTKDNPSEGYRKAEMVYHHIATGQLNFEQAIDQYSMRLDAFPDGKISRLSDLKKTNILGKKPAKQLSLMKVGEVSNLVESDAGQLWIIRLDRMIDRTSASLSESRTSIIEALINERIAKIESNIVSDTLTSMQIQLTMTQSLE